jgi:hypothetical protein
MLGLAAHGGGPGEAEPREVLVDRLLKGRPATASVDVLDSQQELTTGALGGFEGGDG